MAEVFQTTNVPQPLMQLLMDNGYIQPGSAPSYELCKVILLFHPLGAKIAEAPVKKAQSQQREISVPGAPEEVVKEFLAAWKRWKCDGHIFNTRRLARAYGVSTLAMRARGIPGDDVIPPFDLPKKDLIFVTFDPLNTSGSLVGDQNVSDDDFMQFKNVAVQGETFHHSRVCVAMNGEPVYIAYTSSAFGYVGQSVYQRALFPLKTFVQTMITDDMVTQKAGLLIAKIKQPGAIIDRVMQMAAGIKRAMLQGGATGNVLSIQPDESIETLNMMNLDGAAKFARDNVLKNIAAAADMHASFLNQETLAEGFGEGTEDAKNIALDIDREREVMQPLYDFMDDKMIYLAWTPEFYKTIQELYPEQYGKTSFKKAFMAWKNAFTAIWPSLLTEPESEQVKTEDVKFKAAIAAVEVVLPELDPENKAVLIKWLADNLNQNKIMFRSPLVLDYDAMAEYEPPIPVAEPDEPKPEGATT